MIFSKLLGYFNLMQRKVIILLQSIMATCGCLYFIFSVQDIFYLKFHSFSRQQVKKSAKQNLCLTSNLSNETQYNYTHRQHIHFNWLAKTTR
jgi:hypothetical protein